MAETKYNMSITAGTLLYQESLEIAGQYWQLKDWQAVQERVLKQNLLQARTMKTARRICREVIARMKGLTEEELEILVGGSRQEQNQVLWLAICKRFHFIHDFVVEVVREKWLRLDLELTHDDYDFFFNTKAEWHEEMEQLSIKSQKKINNIGWS